MIRIRRNGTRDSTRNESSWTILLPYLDWAPEGLPVSLVPREITVEIETSVWVVTRKGTMTITMAIGPRSPFLKAKPYYCCYYWRRVGKPHLGTDDHISTMCSCGSVCKSSLGAATRSQSKVASP